MGQMRHVWNRNIKLQEQVETLEMEKQDLVAWQTEATDNMLELRSCIEELKGEEAWLQQKLQ